VSGLPHDGCCSRLTQGGRQHLGTLHVKDDRRAWSKAPHRIPAEDHEQLVAVDDFAGFIDRANPVGVTIEGDSELRAGAANRCLQIPEVLRHGGVRMMIREAAIRLAEQRCHLGAQAAKRRYGYHAAHTVAAVDDGSDRPLQLVMGDDRITVALQDRAVGCLLPVPAPPALRHDDFPEVEYILTVKRLTGEHHLETIELGRIVGARHLQTGIGLEGRHGEIERGCRQHTHVDGGSTGLGDALSHTTRQRITAGTIIPADSNHRGPAEPLVRHAAEGAAQGPRELRSQLAVDETSDVVLPEDGFRNVHFSSRVRS
jgi:hypothetical protein